MESFTWPCLNCKIDGESSCKRIMSEMADEFPFKKSESEVLQCLVLELFGEPDLGRK